MKFKVGDKVIAIAEVGKKCIKNITGKIIAIEEHSIPYLVEFDEDINGHDGFGKGKPRHCWWVREYEISPIFVHQKIVITSDGYTTTAKLYDGKTVVKSAEAKCHPDNPFDFTIGANLAYERLMCKTEPKQHKPNTETESHSKQEPIKLYCVRTFSNVVTKGKIYEVNENGRIRYDNGIISARIWDKGKLLYSEKYLVPLVKRPAKVGEWVYIDDAQKTNNAYKNGDIYKVKYTKYDGVYFYTGDITNLNTYSNESMSYANKHEYLVLDGYKPEPEYYNGKVVCIKAGSYHTAGKVYEVKNGVVNCDYDDSGEFTYNRIAPVKTLEQLNANGPVQFIEFKGEVTND